MRFADRSEAGRRLAARLEHLRGHPLVVLGLPRGGVPVAFEVARALDVPLDVILVRKLGVPYQPELAMGAIGEDGVRVINDDIVARCDVTEDELQRVERRERDELERRAAQFRHGRPSVPLTGTTVVIVDDGIATGSTAMAACAVARAHGAARVVLAVPVAPPDCAARLRANADEVICLATPASFFAVGQFYAHFDQTTDRQVVDCLARAAPFGTPREVRSADHEVTVSTGGVSLAGRLRIPDRAIGLVVFAHGSDSSRLSRRNQAVAEVLHRACIGSFLFDLLTADEAADRANVFDIRKLATRLLGVTQWIRTQPGLATIPVGYFGASTGAGAALWAAAETGDGVAAVVSRGGRPDLADERLGSVTAPTLLIVGERDQMVLDLNRRAQVRLTAAETRLVVIPRATHLFEEPGTLTKAADEACAWFADHFIRRPG